MRRELLQKFFTQWLLGVSFLSVSFLAGCASASPPLQAPSPIKTRPQQLIEKAEAATRVENHEAAALALREVVELLAQEKPAAPNLEATRKLCTAAMVEAGGNRASFRLWTDLAQKNPSNPNPKRMEARARALMLQQAEELRSQAKLDAEKKKPQAALCTARASQILLNEADGTKEEKARIKKLVEKLSTRAIPHVGDSTSRKAP